MINSSSAEPPHSGRWDAWLDGYNGAHSDTLTQTVRIPAGCANAAYTFWLHIDTAKTTGQASDTLRV